MAAYLRLLVRLSLRPFADTFGERTKVDNSVNAWFEWC
jgi:hypothetical protein